MAVLWGIQQLFPPKPETEESNRKKTQKKYENAVKNNDNEMVTDMNEEVQEERLAKHYEEEKEKALEKVFNQFKAGDISEEECDRQVYEIRWNSYR